ncbi:MULTISPECIES: tetratricopeptide repeat protein [Planktothrix]|uniref:tetratricopeptide repeat protein n=1 Tax=Planktothrix TaxID=54304 RepID=UPI00130EADAC|nr:MULTISPECIES: tetratricopeptide repeat protein [Planktothrix]
MSDSEARKLADKALFYQNQGQLDQAILSYQQALKIRPNWPEVYYNLGIIFEQQQNLSGAVSCYKQAILQADNYAEAYYNLGVVYQKQGLIEKAIKTYQKTVILAPELIRAYNNLGCLWLEIGEYSQAIEVFTQGINLNPDQAELYNNLGQACLKNGNLDEAIAHYLKAIKLEPNLVKAYQNLGQVFYQQNLFAVALQYFQQGLKIQPDSVSLYSQCAIALLAQKNYPEATIYLQKIVALEQPWITAYCEWTEQFNTEDIIDQATVACGQFLRTLQQQNPDINQVKKYLAQTYLYLGNAFVEYRNYQSAERYYQLAVDIDPKLAETYIHWGDSLAKQWRFNDAALQYHQALGQHPQNPDFYQKVSQVLEKQQQVEQGKLKFILVKDRENLTLPISLQNPDLSQPKCQGLDCQPCLKKLRQYFRPQHLGLGIEQYFPLDDLPDKLTETTVTIIPQGRVWVAPKISWWNVCNAIAIFNKDKELIPELSRFYPTPLPNCKNYDWSQHQIFSLAEIPPLKIIEGRVAVLSGLSGNVYFHWLVDILPRIKILPENGIDLDSIDWFLINSTQQNFQRETLEKIGIPHHKIIETDQVSYLQASSLIVPSYPASVGWVVPHTINFLRSLFLTDISPPIKTYSPRIYISRNQARYRRLLNEPEILDYLSSWGFVSVDLETLTVQEQANLFSQVEVIIAPHGAGLTNLVFCQPHTVVIELVSPHYLRPYYWQISQQLGLQHYSIQGESLECAFLQQLMYPTPLFEDIQINLKSLQRLLQVCDILKDKGKSYNSSGKPRIIMPSSVDQVTTLANRLQEAKNHLAQNHFESAILACQKVLETDVNCGEAYTILGNVLQLQGKFEQAHNSYKTAIQLQPESPEPLGNLGSLYARKQQWDLAVKYYQLALKYKPNCDKLYRNLAKVLTKLNRPDEATECWYHSYRLQPEQAGATEHLELGKTLLEQGKSTEAIACFQNAISSSKNSELFLQTKLEAYSLMAKALYQSNQLEEALQTYQKLLQLNPQDAIAYTNLGNLYAKRQDWKSALTAYQKAIAFNPNLAIAYRHLGEVFQQLGDQDQAIEYWYQGFNIEPTAFRATDHLALGHLLWQKGLLKPATTCYRHALECDPNNATAYHNLGEVLVAQGQLEAAIDAYYQAIELHPSFETYNSLGKVLGLQGRWQEVIACYRQGMELNPRLLMAMQTLTQALAYSQNHQGQGESQPLFSLMAGEVLSWQPQIQGNTTRGLLRGEQEQPLQKISVSVSYTVAESDLVQQAQKLFDQQQYLPCILQCEQIAASQPQEASVYLLWGKALMAVGRREEAQQRYQTALQLQPQQGAAYLGLGEIYAQEKYWKEAIACYQKALTIQPHNSEIYALLGDIYAEQEEWDNAIQSYQTALQFNPDFVSVQEALGDIGLSQGQWHLAIQYYQNVLALDPQLQPVYQKLGDALWQVGEINAAIDAYRKATEI